MEHNIRKGLRAFPVGVGGTSSGAVSYEEQGKRRSGEQRCPPEDAGPLQHPAL